MPQAHPARFVLVAVLLMVSAMVASAQTRVPPPKPPQGAKAGSNASDRNQYVNPKVCTNCHAEIAENYRKTGMGRSFYRLSALNLVEDFQSGKPFFHTASDSYFAMVERDGKYYQRRWQIGFDGKDTNVEEKQIDYVMGSGNHSRTYLHLTSRNTLQQLPLAWYSEKGGYFAMNPGYDQPEYKGSTRAIHYECMFCHNAYPGIPKGNEEVGTEAQYLQPLPEGIDCQRCHGPGQRHVNTAGRAGAKAEEIRAAIVNPTRLSTEREMEVCMQCHLETTSRLLPHSIQRMDRGPFSYKPGESLADFRLSFDRALGKNEEFEIAHGAYRLRQSRCFIESAGKMRCTTCHDPHNIPRAETAQVHYNGVCLSCHVTLPSSVEAHTAKANCLDCHMPKRRTDDAIHIVMTDHLIVRRLPPGDLLAEKTEKRESPVDSYRGEVVPYYPAKPAPTVENSLYLALAQISDRSNLQAGLRQLSGLIAKYHPAQAGFYSGLAQGYLSVGDKAKALAYLEEAARRAPASEIVLLELADALLESKEWAKAEATLRRAKILKPDDPAAWGLLGWVLWQQHKTAEAKTALETGVKLDPEMPNLRNYLASVYLGAGDFEDAERELRSAVAINPGAADSRSALAGLLGSRGQLAEAQYQFEESLRLHPDYAPARLNYARLLANMDRLTDSELQAKAAVESDPNLPGAHELWGYLLSAKGDLAGAIRELQAALRIQPASPRAHYELGLALGQSGRHAEAQAELKAAAKSGDPQVREAALQVLRRLGQ